MSDDEEVTLPNGVTLRRGSRVRVPADLIWHPDVLALAERGVELEEGSQSRGSEVLRWPWSARRLSG